MKLRLDIRKVVSMWEKIKYLTKRAAASAEVMGNH